MTTYTAVFQMIEGANDQQKESLGIMTPDYYCYLNQSGTYKVDGTNDSKDFQETMVHMQYTGGIYLDHLWDGVGVGAR